MGRFDDVLRFLATREDQREAKMNRRDKLTIDEVATMRARYPGVPEDYTDYLAEVGWGAVRECSYAIFQGLIDPSEIFGENAATLEKRILCFGDNFAGDPAGFLPDEGWKVVEIWHDSMEIHDTKQSFSEFIREKIINV